MSPYCCSLYIVVHVSILLLRGHFTQKLKNGLLTWCYSGQNGTIAELHVLVLHVLVLSHLQENFNYCIIRKLRFFNYPCTTRNTYPVFAYQLSPRTRCVFSPNECLSLNGALAYLEWLLVLQILRGERPKTKVTPEVKKNNLSNTKFFFFIALRTVILNN